MSEQAKAEFLAAVDQRKAELAAQRDKFITWANAEVASFTARMDELEKLAATLRPTPTPAETTSMTEA